jgi:hypothetical protein
VKPGLALLCAALCVAGGAHAARPAAPPENPAVDTMQQKPEDGPGTTIVGEHDSDLGLYLTPWKEEHADNLDPPPGLLDVPPQAIEPRRFARQVRDAATINAYRREQLQPNR